MVTVFAEHADLRNLVERGDAVFDELPGRAARVGGANEKARWARRG
jgi:hypothetical protein